MNPNEEIPPEVVPRAYYNQPVWKRIVVILAGPAVNLVIAFVIVWALVISAGQPVTSHGQPVLNKDVAAVATSSPAASVLKPGDQIVSVDGVSGSAEAIRTADRHPPLRRRQVNGCVAATPAEVVVQRDGKLRHVRDPPALQSAPTSAPQVGFSFGQRHAAGRRGRTRRRSRSASCGR